jgi:cytochrome P450
MQLPFVPLHLLNSDTATPLQTRLGEIEALSNLAENHWLIQTTIGFYIPRREDVSNILRDPRWHNGVIKLLSQQLGMSGGLENNRSKVLLSLEGEEHDKIKKKAHEMMGPSRSASHSSICSSISSKIIKSLPDSDALQADIAEDIIFRYPSSVMSSVLGIPESDWPFIDEITGILMRHLDGVVPMHSEEARRADMAFSKYLERAFYERRKDGNGVDLISDLLRGQKEMGMDDNELKIFIGSLFGGGVDTVRSQLGLVFDYLLDNPDTYSSLRENPSSIPAAVEEMCRIHPTVRGSVRYASEDIEYKGFSFPKGTFVFLGFFTGNLDKSIRKEPLVVDVEAPKYPVLTFSGGTHYCVGHSLARIEMTELVSAFANRFSRIERCGEPQYKASNAGVFGPVSLPAKLFI